MAPSPPDYSDVGATSFHVSEMPRDGSRLPTRFRLGSTPENGGESGEDRPVASGPSAEEWSVAVLLIHRGALLL